MVWNSLIIEYHLKTRVDCTNGISLFLLLVYCCIHIEYILYASKSCIKNHNYMYQQQYQIVYKYFLYLSNQLTTTRNKPNRIYIKSQLNISVTFYCVDIYIFRFHLVLFVDMFTKHYIQMDFFFCYVALRQLR